MAAKRVGKYRVGKELGRGPLGRVFAAVDSETKRRVVIRGFARPADADDEHWQQSIDRFTRELEMAQKLDHPNIAEVHDFGERNGLYFVATEFFIGRPLRQIIDQDGPQTVEQVTPILQQICEALDYAHAAGAASGDATPYHEDLTPFNVLVTKDGTVKIINFGLGNVRNKRESPYLSPEQEVHQPAGPSSDMWAVGVLLFELLSGDLPFVGHDAEELSSAIVSAPPAALHGDIPDYVRAIIAKLLQKDPAQRYQSGAELMEDWSAQRAPEGVAPLPGQVETAAATETAPSLAEYDLQDQDVSQAPARTDEEQPEPGGKRVGPYVLGDELGVGPLGKVFVAAHAETGDKVVFRGFTRPAKADDAHWADSIQRFHAELEQAQKLEHPNIARVVDFGEEGDVFYVATEFFTGRNLRQLHEERALEDPELVGSMLSQICAALDHAASRNISHTDLTPFNILLTDDGVVKIINYGLGHIRNKQGSAYIAPEQWRGHPGNLESDIWSLGIIVYELLSGRVPFRGRDADELERAVMRRRPAPLLSAPDYVQGIVLKMLAKHPTERYHSGEELWRDWQTQRVPIEYADQVVKPGTLADKYRTGRYEALPSLADYKLDDSDMIEIHRRVATREERIRERIDQGLRLAIGLAGAYVVLGLLWSTIRAPHNETHVTVAAMEGFPEAFAPDGTGWEQVRLKQQLAPGTTVRTSAGSRLLLRTRNGSRLKLGKSSVLDIDDITYDAKTMSRHLNFALRRGKAWMNVRKLGGQDSEWNFFTAGIRVAITGTVVGVDTDVAEGAANVDVFRGSAKVIGDKKTRELGEGQRQQAVSGQLTGEPVEIPQSVRDLLQEQADLLQDPSVAEQVQTMIAGLQNSTALRAVGAIVPAGSGGAGAGGEGEEGGGLSGIFSGAVEMQKAQVALYGLKNSMEMFTEYPAKLSPTLDELDLDQEGRQRILKCFHGERIESYELKTPDYYAITVIANDPKKTRLRLYKGKVDVLGPTAESGAHGGGSENGSGG